MQYLHLADIVVVNLNVIPIMYADLVQYLHCFVIVVVFRCNFALCTLI